MFVFLNILGEKHVFPVRPTHLTLPYTPNISVIHFSLCFGKTSPMKTTSCEQKKICLCHNRQSGTGASASGFILGWGTGGQKKAGHHFSTTFSSRFSFLFTPSTTSLDLLPFCPFIPFSSPLVLRYKQSECSNVPPMFWEKFSQWPSQSYKSCLFFVLNVLGTHI